MPQPPEQETREKVILNTGWGFLIRPIRREPVIVVPDVKVSEDALPPSADGQASEDKPAVDH